MIDKLSYKLNRHSILRNGRRALNRKRKGNDRGSTLIIVLVVVAFVSILGTVTVTSAMLNLKMKMVDKGAKKSFYTAEQAVNQVYASLGVISMDTLKDCYNEELGSLTVQQKILANDISSIDLSNEEYNNELRTNYLDELLNRLFGLSGWTGYPGNISEISGSGSTEVGIHTGGSTESSTEAETESTLVSKLNDYINTDNLSESSNQVLEIESVGEKQVSKQSSAYDGLACYTIELNDCTIKYENEEGYQSYVTVDFALQLPDILFHFVDASSSKLTTFGEYSLIGCSGIFVANQKNVTLEGTKIYAGGGSDASDNGGVGIGFGATLNAINSSVISGGGFTLGKDIKLAGEATTDSGHDSSFVEDAGSQLWCSNLDITDEVSASDLVLKGNTFVQDDLTIDGNDNSATISGNYIGWGYEGDTDAQAGHSNSSAMIVNGSNCTLNISDVRSMILGGRAYINVNNDTNSYMTGESISLKADQEIYLIPDSFLKKSSSSDDYYMNPVSADATVTVTIPDTFFAYNWLDDTNQYNAITDQDSGLVYYYFNIKEEYQDDYLSAIVNYDPADGVDVYLASMKNLVISNITRLQQQSLVTSGSNANMYLNGGMICATIANSASTASVSGDAGLNSDDFYQDSAITEATSGSLDGESDFYLTEQDMQIRYALLTHVLYEAQLYKSDATVTADSSLTVTRILYGAMPHDIIYNGSAVNIDSTTEDVFTNFVNKSWLENKLTTSAYTPSTQTDSSSTKVYITKDTLDQNLVVDSSGTSGSVNISHGLIITTGNVIVKQDFDGLIIAEGTILIDNGVTITNSYGDIETLLSNVDAADRADVENFLLAWNELSTPDTTVEEANGIFNVQYQDLVSYLNWEKGERE